MAGVTTRDERWEARDENNWDDVRTVKRVMIALLVAAVAFLAAFIITLNFYSTWRAFAHEPVVRSDVFYWGFLLAGTISMSAFSLTLYLLHIKKKRAVMSTFAGPSS